MPPLTFGRRVFRSSSFLHSGSPLPTCIASTSTLPIEILDSPSIPSRSSATLTSFKGGRRLIIDSDDELNSPTPSPPPNSPLSTDIPNTKRKGKGRQTIIHDLSDSDSSSSASDSNNSPRRTNEEITFDDDDEPDYWGDGNPSNNSSSTGVLSFSPPPPPKNFLPPSSSSSPNPTPYSPSPPPPNPPAPAPRCKPTPNILPKPHLPPSGKKLNSKAWKTHRSQLALDLISELDEGVFERKVRRWLRLDEELDDDGGREKKDEPRGVVWTGKLRTTAGMSRWCRKKTKCAAGGEEMGDGGCGYEHFCRIELSAKVSFLPSFVLSLSLFRSSFACFKFVS